MPARDRARRVRARGQPSRRGRARAPGRPRAVPRGPSCRPTGPIVPSDEAGEACRRSSRRPTAPARRAEGRRVARTGNSTMPNAETTAAPGSHRRRGTWPPKLCRQAARRCPLTPDVRAGAKSRSTSLCAGAYEMRENVCKCDTCGASSNLVGAEQGGQGLSFHSLFVSLFPTPQRAVASRPLPLGRRPAPGSRRALPGRRRCRLASFMVLPCARSFECPARGDGGRAPRNPRLTPLAP